MPYVLNTIPMTPFQHRLMILKLSLKSFFTPYKKKREYLDRITFESRKIAIDRGLIFAFFTLISYGRGSSYETIAQINWEKSYIHRAVDIVFFTRLIMAPEHYIKITIFHEYCHFLMKAIPNPMIWQMAKFYSTNRFPHLHNDMEEDFCDLFGYYIVDKDTGDQELNSFLEEFIRNTEAIIDKQNWIFRAVEMPDYYLDPDPFRRLRMNPK